MIRRPVDEPTVEIVGAERYDECVHFIFDHFFPRERLAVASGLDRRPFYGASELYRKWLAEGVSLMAYDRSAGRLAALCLNFLVDRDQEMVVDYASMSRENRVIWTFLDSLEAGYDVFQSTGSSRGLELVFLCVRDEYTGRGLAGKLTEATLRLAGQQGLGFVKSNPTTAATYRVFQKFGFQLVNRMKLAEFSDAQGPAFPHADADDSAGFVVKKL